MPINGDIGLHDAPWYLRQLRRGAALTMPAPRFLWAHQGVDFRSDPTCSWWHVAVRLRRGAFKTKLEGCRIFVIRRWGPDWPGDGIHMRWRDDVAHQGRKEITLRSGETYQVPIAWRDETEQDGTAFITNENWLLSGGQDRKWPLHSGRIDAANHPAGRYEFWLEIRSGSRRWRSGHVYVLAVPPQEIGNGFFTLEAVYL